MTRPSSTEIAAVDSAVEALMIARKRLAEAARAMDGAYLNADCWNDCASHPIDAVSDAAGALDEWISAGAGWLAVHARDGV